MNAAIEALNRVEAEVAQLLAAGLGTRRAGRERLVALAEEVARLRLERLAVELRILATTDDPTKATGAAMACLTLARKLRERLDPWPEVDLASGTVVLLDSRARQVGAEPSPQPSAGERSADSERGLSGSGNDPHPVPPEAEEGSPSPHPLGRYSSPSPRGRGGPGVRSVLPSAESVAESVDSLLDRFVSGDSLARADAARQVVALGDAGVPALSRLAAKGTLTIRREAIACLGQIGTEAALRALAGCLGTEDAQRALLAAARSLGERAVPALVTALGHSPKRRDNSRLTAAWLLYRLGADATLRDHAEDPEEVVAGFGLASQARVTGDWQAASDASRRKVYGDQTRDTLCVLQAEATGEVGPVVEALDARPAARAGAAAAYLVGAPLETALGEHYVVQLAKGTAKDRKRAEHVLTGLADPTLVPRLAAAYDRGEVDVVALALILGAAGGDQAVGLLLDMTRGTGNTETVAHALGLLGEPSTAPWLFELVSDGSTLLVQPEMALVGLGDGAVDYLAGELRGGGVRSLRAQRILLQIREQRKSERAARALEGTDPESLDLLLSYLGHPTLGKSAIGKLGRLGDSALDALADVVSHGPHPARLDAIAAIAAVKTPRASAVVHDVVEGIVAGGRPGSDAHVAAKGIELLPAIRNERTVPLIARGIGVVTQMPQVAGAASEALVKLGRESVPYILPYLDHPNAFARVLALRALGGLAAPEAEARAIELLADPDFSVAHAATDALGRIGRATGSVSILDALAAKAVSPSASWPAQYISALGATRDPAAIPRLRAIARAFRDRRSPLASNVEMWVAGEIQSVEKSVGKVAAKAEPAAPPQGGGLLGSVRRLFGGK